MAGAPATRRATVLLALATLALPTAYAVWLGVRAVAYRYPLDYGEGPLLDQALRLAQGQGIYAIPGHDSPWTISNYPPLYPLLEAAAARVFGPVYWFGRLISLLSSLGAAVVVGLLVHRLSHDRLAATVAGLLLPAVPFVCLWSGYARIDTLALLLSLTGLLLLVRDPGSTRTLAISLLLFTAAAFTRQTSLLAAPLAAFCWLWRPYRRHAVALAAGLFLTVASIGLVLNLATNGGFWFNIVTANINEIDLGTRWYRDFVAGHLPVLAALAVVYVLWSLTRPDPTTRVILPYLLGSLVVGLTVVKVGSNVNYVLELSAGAAMATGAVLARLRTRPRWRLGVLALLAVQAVVLLVRTDLYDGVNRQFADQSAIRQIEQLVQGLAGPVLADQEMGLLPLTGQALVLQPFEMTELSRAGRWDQKPLLAAIEGRRYSAILILYLDGFPVEQQRWTSEQLAAIRTSYQATEEIPRFGGRTVVYRPRR